MVQNDRRFCLLHSIYQEPFIKWLSFMVHIYKMIISPGISFILSEFWFLLVSGVKGQKNGPKWQKILSVTLDISGTINDKKICCAPYLRNHTSYDCHLWYTFVKWQHFPCIFFHSYKILMRIIRGVKGQKMAQNDNSVCLTSTLHHRSTLHHMIVIFGTRV